MYDPNDYPTRAQAADEDRRAEELRADAYEDRLDRLADADRGLCSYEAAEAGGAAYAASLEQTRRENEAYESTAQINAHAARIRRARIEMLAELAELPAIGEAA